MRSIAVCLSAVLAFSTVAGCATATQSDSEGFGQLQLPLVTNAGGTAFRLSAQFIVTDAATGASQVFDASGDAAALQLSLPSGGYTVTIADGFFLERAIFGQPFQPVSAVLASDKTVAVAIEPGSSTFVTFEFLIANEAPAQGFLNIVFGVAAQRGQLVGTLFFSAASGVLAPYLQAPPPSFSAPYIITGEGVLSEPPTHDFFTGTVGFRVLSDGVGAIASFAPDLAGGTLGFAIVTQPDDRQHFSLFFRSAINTAFSQLTIETGDLQPRVPTPGGRIAEDPVRSRFRATIPFQLLLGGLEDNAGSGVIDLQFLP